MAHKSENHNTTSACDTQNDAPHIPVMLEEVLHCLDPQDHETYIDGTFGAGGYSKAILNHAQTNIIAFDRDPSAIKTAHALQEKYGQRLTSIHSDFGDMLTQCQKHGFEQVDGIVLDLGVSSMQLDQAQRGFSFQRDGDLDMRMDDSKESGMETAAELIDRISIDNLADILYLYGEEHKSRRIARTIKEEHAKAPITTTLQLANIVAKANPQSPKVKTHPATKTFQALRIAVNDELGQLEKALDASLSLLKPKGRLVIVSFHSLEDRIVKQFLRQHSGANTTTSRHLPSLELTSPSDISVHFTLPSKKALSASTEEIKINPRSRSAKLRYAIRTSTPSADHEAAKGQ